MSKEELRNKLFDKYFKVDNGILVTDLVSSLSFIPELWKKLHSLCEKNIEYFDTYSSLWDIKLIQYKENDYLILKLSMFSYAIIDVEKMENIAEDQFKNEFEEVFFVNNFDERKAKDGRSLFALYSIDNYEGDIKELYDFYIENQSLLSLTPCLHYRINYENAWTYLHIDFINGKAQLGFQTKDQYLYEQLFLKYDFTPAGMQDAQSKIGEERMKEIFEKTREIRIPIEVIPEDLYKHFLFHYKEDKVNENFSNGEIEFLKNNIDKVIDIFCSSHEELKEELNKLDDQSLLRYFPKYEWDKDNVNFERNKFFSIEGARDTYHNYYCYVFALIMKDLFKDFAFYERFDGAHVAVGCDKYIFDVCGVYYELDGEIYDNDGDLYWDATDDDWFISELKYFGRLNEELEARLKSIFYNNLKKYLNKDKREKVTLSKSINSNNTKN